MLTYLYSGTRDGFFTVIYRIYHTRKVPDNITSSPYYEYGLDAETYYVSDDPSLSKVICDCLLRRIGQSGLNRIKIAFAYGGADKEMIIFRYVRLIFRFGRESQLFKNDRRVIAFDDICGKVLSEAHKFKGFLRFSELANGIMYAQYEPDNDITAPLLDFFSDKLNTLKLIIHDTSRNLLGMYNGTEKRIEYIKDSQFPEPVYSQDEPAFRTMWHAYFNNVSIKQRANPRLQDNYMPRRYRKNMCETFPANDLYK